MIKKGYEIRVDKIFDYFGKEFMNNASILDCASGNGSKGLLLYLEKGLDVKQFTAVDVDKDKLEKLSLLGVNTNCVNLENEKLISIIDNRFDIILCVETIEHLSVEAENKLIFSFLKLLKKGGSIVFTFPKKVKFDKHLYGHLRQPNYKKIINEMDQYFHDIFFEVVNKRYFIFLNNKVG